MAAGGFCIHKRLRVDHSQIVPFEEALKFSSQRMNRRTFLERTALGSAGLLIAPYGRCAEESRSETSEAALIAQARKQIAEHRIGKGIIQLRGTDGKALRGANIKIEQVRHEFLFGSNILMFGRHGDAQLEQDYRNRFKELLNFATLGFYWADYEREPGKPRYEYTDQAVEFCREHGITCKGHPLAWDHSVSTPGWLPPDLADVKKLSLQRVHDIVSRYKGEIEIWDVVNEATHLYEKKIKSRIDDLGIAMGQVEYVAEHVKAAREANPEALLLVNDYKTGPNYYELLDKLRERGALIFDAVGIQSHMHRGVWPTRKVWDICDMFARFRLPLHFTETTVVSGKRASDQSWGPTTPEDEAKQGDDVVNFYTALFGHPAVEAITWWDFSDYGAWQGAPAGWLRNDMSPKPVYDRLMALLKKEWWTKTSGLTDRNGNIPFHGFYGSHRISGSLSNGNTFTREFEWRRGHTTLALTV
jgi:endo-1,4-beta-xylanase